MPRTRPAARPSDGVRTPSADRRRPPGAQPTHHLKKPMVEVLVEGDVENQRMLGVDSSLLLRARSFGIAKGQTAHRPAKPKPAGGGAGDGGRGCPHAERMYLSRDKYEFKARKVNRTINNRTVQEVLKSKGFNTIFPEELSLEVSIHC